MKLMRQYHKFVGSDIADSRAVTVTIPWTGPTAVGSGAAVVRARINRYTAGVERDVRRVAS